MYREIPEKKKKLSLGSQNFKSVINNRLLQIEQFIDFFFSLTTCSKLTIFTKLRVRPNSFSARASTSILVARDTPGNRARCTGCPDTGGNDTLFSYEASSLGRLSCSNNDYNAVPALDATLDNGRHVDHPYSLAFPCSLSATRFNLNKINS